ncbi:MAG: AEC family transporter [Turicibacter sp.]|nr:AEC family transporter [Turicibacter sp.]
MELAAITFHQIFMMVLLLGLGLLCAKAGIIDAHTNKKLSALLTKVVTPAVVIVSFQRPMEAQLLRGLGMSALMSLMAFAIMIPLSHLLFQKKQGEGYAIERFAAVYSNCGFIGIPLVNGVFGMEGVFYLSAFIALFNLLAFTHGAMTMQGGFNRRLLAKAACSPAVLGVLFGFFLFWSGISLPEIILAPLGLVGNLNTPLAMLVGGASMLGMDALGMLQNKRLFYICFWRLAAFPILLLGVFHLVPAPQMITGTVLIAASAPVAATLMMLSYEYGRDTLYASELFTASTLLSMATLPLLMLFL